MTQKTATPAEPRRPAWSYVLAALLALGVLAFLAAVPAIELGWKLIVLGAGCWLAAIPGGRRAKTLLIAGALLAAAGWRVKAWHAQQAARAAVVEQWAAVKADCQKSLDRGRHEDAAECFGRMLEADPGAPDAGDIAGRREEAQKLAAQLAEKQKAQRLQEGPVIGKVVFDFLNARQARILAMGGGRVIMKNVRYTYSWTNSDNSRFLADGSCDIYTSGGKFLNTTDWKFEAWKDTSGAWKHADRTIR